MARAALVIGALISNSIPWHTMPLIYCDLECDSTVVGAIDYIYLIRPLSGQGPDKIYIIYGDSTVGRL